MPDLPFRDILKRKPTVGSPVDFEEELRVSDECAPAHSSRQKAGYYPKFLSDPDGTVFLSIGGSALAAMKP